MTARYEIRQLLSSKDHPITRAEIVLHVIGKNYDPSTAKSSLARMENIGEVINSGEYRKGLYSLNADFIPKEEVRKEKQATYSRKSKAPRCTKDIFSLCRKHSRIYQLIDQPLRGVRV